MPATKEATANTSVSAGLVIRKFGPLERWMAAKYVAQPYYSTAVTCRYTLPPDLVPVEAQGRLSTHLERAIARVALSHPLMQVGIINERSKKPSFIALDNLDLKHHIEWRLFTTGQDYDASFQETIQKLVDTDFDDLATRPAWKVFVFRHNNDGRIEVVFGYRHTFTDGIGGKIFHQTLSKVLHADYPNDNDMDLDLSNDDDHILRLEEHDVDYYPPAMEEMGKLAMSARFLATVALHELQPSSIVAKKQTLAHWAPMTLDHNFTQRAEVQVNAARMQLLLQACREHKTTFTGLLHGICFVSFAQQLSAKQAPAFTTNTAINLRPFLPVHPPKHPDRSQHAPSIMANIVTALNHEFDVDFTAEMRRKMQPKPDSEADADAATITDVIWRVATLARQQIQQKLTLKNHMSNAIKYVPDCLSELQKEAKRPRIVSWHISNLGTIDPVPSGSTTPDAWVIDRAHFTSSVEPIGPVVAVRPMSVKEGQMCLSLEWSRCERDNRVGQQLRSDLIRCLEVL